MFAPTELRMWHDLEPQRPVTPSDDEINSKYVKRELRIVTETNREQLPNFVAALDRPQWMELTPFYQRRKRWDDARKSKLIESFIMNIPVPPCFLYESEFARYEVMDGQQRISSISEFYKNRFSLKGLQQWPELNGRFYSTLPSQIKQGLDRRSISYIVLLKESATSTDDEILLRQQVFERLNTGGVELENQEIRHCIYHNAFDDLLVILSRQPALRRAWKLPLYSQEEEGNPPETLLRNPTFSKMRDVEFVLRFFALRHVEHYRGGMQQFLDNYMVRSRRFTAADLDILGRVFVDTLQLAEDIYQNTLFRPWIPEKNQWATTPQLAFADAMLVGLSFELDDAPALRRNAASIVEGTKEIIRSSPAGTFTGRANTRDAIKFRIDKFREMLQANR